MGPTPPIDSLPGPDDLGLISEQLGRQPRGLVGIAARCPAGHPCVITSYPLLDPAPGRSARTSPSASHRRTIDRRVPFPTLYWLTCPRVVQAIARLERSGLIGALEARLQRDAGLAAALRNAHEAYIVARWSCLDPADRPAAARLGLRPGEATRGIGGIADWMHVKCLHLHFAHHLVAENPIGRILAEEHGLQPCAAAAGSLAAPRSPEPDVPEPHAGDPAVES
jgi:hypothetical protein